MTRSRDKGARGERELAQALRDLGVTARRGQQYSGLEGQDVVSDLPVHWECKRVEQLRLYPALEQAVEDARPGAVPVVAHRRNRQPWVVVLRLEDFVRLAQAAGPQGPIDERGDPVREHRAAPNPPGNRRRSP